MGERKKYDQVFCLHFILFSSIYREKKYEVEKNVVGKIIHSRGYALIVAMPAELRNVLFTMTFFVGLFGYVPLQFFEFGYTPLQFIYSKICHCNSTST
jgi:hypothetical protein